MNATAGGGAPHSNRFPEAGRRKVANLATPSRKSGPQLVLIYIAAALLAAPLIFRLHWYTNEGITQVGFVFCLLILLIPALGFWIGFKLLNRCATASAAAEMVDLRTQGLFDDSATLQAHARETLAGYYDATGTTQVTIVDALRADALRRAMVDRWEPSSWLVDAYHDELSAGLPLIVTLQRLSLQLGILFTFIGLAVAFSTDAFSMTAGVREIPDMQPLITALQVKFMASIAGLISSICLLSLSWACRQELAATISRLDVMVDNILTLAKTMRSDPTFASDFSQIRESVQRMDSRIDGLADGYAKVVSTVRDGVADLSIARDELKSGLATLIEAQSKVVSEVDRFYGRIVPEDFADEVGESVKVSMAAFGQQLDRTGESIRGLNAVVVALTETEQRLSRQGQGTRGWYSSGEDPRRGAGSTSIGSNLFSRSGVQRSTDADTAGHNRITAWLAAITRRMKDWWRSWFK